MVKSSRKAPTLPRLFSLVARVQYQPGSKFFEILVPTVDTVRTAALAEALCDLNFPALVTGATGVGKSVVLADMLTHTADKKARPPPPSPPPRQPSTSHMYSYAPLLTPSFHSCAPALPLPHPSSYAHVRLPQSLVPIGLNFSAQTSSARTQEMIESKLIKRQTKFVAPAGKHIVLFIGQ